MIARRQRVGVDDDRLRVVGNDDREDATEEGPRRLARLDRARGRLLEGRIHEAMARADRREDPRAKPTPAARRQREPADPARIELQFLAGRAVEHRDRGRRLAKLQLAHREAIERRVGDRDALPREQLPNLRQPQPVGEPPFDHRALRDTLRPAVAAGPAAQRLQPEQRVADLVVGDRAPLGADARRGRGLQIPPHRFRIEPELRRQPLPRQARAPQAQHFFDFDHRDLAIHPASWPGCRPRTETVRRAVRRGGKWF